MDNVVLGRTSIEVSRLCFGTLTLSPLQANLGARKSSALICCAFDNGVNFLDTAELYNNYDAIALAVKYKPDAVIATKCYAFDAQTASRSFEKAVKGIGREYIDIFMLHEQESEHTLRGHEQALEFFYKKKLEGSIRAIGISTHHIAGVKAAASHGAIDVVEPIYNAGGIGIADGSRLEMEEAVRECHEAGIGVVAMKPLGGGHLIGGRESALRYALNSRHLDSIAIGMQSEAEIGYNCAFFCGNPTLEFEGDISTQKRRLHIDDWCEGCGKCVEACQHGALNIIGKKAAVNSKKCLFCGYCASRCPQFCIKVV